MVRFENMRNYQLVLIFRSSFSETQRKKSLDTIKEWLKGLKITKEDAWGEKTLAYPIKRETKGIYHLLFVEGDAAVPTDLDKRLSANENILRHLLVRTK